MFECIFPQRQKSNKEGRSDILNLLKKIPQLEAGNIKRKMFECIFPQRQKYDNEGRSAS